MFRSIAAALLVQEVEKAPTIDCDARKTLSIIQHESFESRRKRIFSFRDGNFPENYFPHKILRLSETLEIFLQISAMFQYN